MMRHVLTFFVTLHLRKFDLAIVLFEIITYAFSTTVSILRTSHKMSELFFVPMNHGMYLLHHIYL